ncbi:MAG TPA: phage portal protein [Anaerolineales bacterium]|nr:phage portal protein [Anaerolineales bacterium]
MALSFWDRMRLSMARGLLKATALPIVPPWVRASWLDPIWRNLVREGYKSNAAVFACINTFAFFFPEPPLRIYGADGNPVSNHPGRKLVMRPNPKMGEPTFWSKLITYTAIGGNAYGHLVRSAAGRVVEIWPYHAGNITPIPGGETWISHYVYDPTGSGATTGKDVREIPIEDIVHFQWPAADPEQPWQGMPPLRAVAREVDADNEATRYLFALLKNDAMPRTAMIIPENVTLDDGQYGRLKAQYREQHGGDNRGGLMILEGGADIKRIGLDLKELAFEALHAVPEKRIAGAFRTPLSVAGLGDDPTFSNSDEAYRRYTQGTLAPLWVLFAGEMQAMIAREFGEGEARFDTTNVKAMGEDTTARWTRTLAGMTAGALTVNEFRAANGYASATGGDVFIRDPNKETVPAKIEARPQKALPAPDTKAAAARSAAIKAAQRLQRLRASVANEMETDVNDFFAELADRMVERLSKRAAAGETKVQSAEDLIDPEDENKLEELLKYWYVDLLQQSWQTWNTALGVRVSFDRTDLAVTAALADSGTRIKDIMATTLGDVRELLQYASEQGWSVDKIARGDADHPGLRDIVEQTYKNRGRTIARTELGTAQQIAAVGRYGAAGVTKVLVLDDGFEDSDPVCKELGAGGQGTVKSLEWATKNPLQHPNCVRAFAPWFD